MSAEMPLGVGQLAQLRQGLLLFGELQRQRGRRIFRHSGVSKAVWEVVDRTVVAQVRGGRQYTTRLELGSGSLETLCTCPFGEYCKHAAALAYFLLGRAVGLPVCDEAVVEIEPAAEALLAQARSKSPSGLTAAASKFLIEANAWWEARKDQATAGEISQLCGRAAFWGYNDQNVKLFPPTNPPETVWEYLAYLFLSARRLNLMLPPPLPDLIDPDMVSRLGSESERAAEIMHWRRSLSTWGETDGAGHSVPPDLRLRLQGGGATVEAAAAGGGFARAPRQVVEPIIRAMRAGRQAGIPLGAALVARALTDSYGGYARGDIKSGSDALVESLAGLIGSPDLFRRHVVGADGDPLPIVAEPLRWLLDPPTAGGSTYQLRLCGPQAETIPAPVAIIPGTPWRYVTDSAVYSLDYWPFSGGEMDFPIMIPGAALESSEGLTALGRLGIPFPSRLASRVRTLSPSVVVKARVHRPRQGSSDYLHVNARAIYEHGGKAPLQWNGESWVADGEGTRELVASADGEIFQYDHTPLAAASVWVRSLPLRPVRDYSRETWLEQRIFGKDWAGQFIAWLDSCPEGCQVKLDPELASLRSGRVSGSVRLDIEESPHGIDWFDLKVVLQLSDTELTPAEVGLLLKAQGRWVRLTGKGWRKLDLEIDDAQRSELASLGLAAHEFGAENQRLHALQLGALGEKKNSLLSANRAREVRRRIEQIKTRVTPPLPSAITAELRPYQVEGFHFLSYLTENNFGGVLADDMGLGKTLQALAWIAWLRAEKKIDRPVLVVCPKSVQDNWRGESAKFFPGLKVDVWSRTTAGQSGLDGSADLLVIHYVQLRNHADLLQSVPWGAVILDEAQAIKNPSSQNARVACALATAHRLALTGTPVENRLMDLWSIFAFAMPGVLGTKAAFAKHFEHANDPLARRRLAARTRPFLLRRTKKEVASDLPERIEEDLVIEFDGTQAALYQAELKRARAELLRVRTSRQLDKLRFSILTSLLRLRQICCHPQLVGFEGDGKRRKRKIAAAPQEESSAKISALLETLEPLIEEGQKVLVFSQFVQMLEIIEQELAARGWSTFKLTGETDDRGPLVDSFQRHDGAAVFLISLKAGGTGLNLTAASYVVLFDPWWNPAVEAQAIDRTHRIGQKKTVFAYRLLIKGTIEEKIRLLQKQKGALASDILGEESFAQALTLDDFRFLLGGDEEA